MTIFCVPICEPNGMIATVNRLGIITIAGASQKYAFRTCAGVKSSFKNAFTASAEPAATGQIIPDAVWSKPILNRGGNFPLHPHRVGHNEHQHRKHGDDLNRAEQRELFPLRQLIDPGHTVTVTPLSPSAAQVTPCNAGTSLAIWLNNPSMLV